MSKDRLEGQGPQLVVTREFAGLMVSLRVDSFPGFPPSDVVLTALRRRCKRMPDVAALGTGLLDRLEGLQDAVAELEEAAPERRMFIDCLVRLAKLTARKPLLVRLATSDAIAQMIQQLHTQVDEVAGRVNRSASDVLTWRETWAGARVQQMVSLKQQIERATDRQLMKELRDDQLGEMVYMQLKRNVEDASLGKEMVRLVAATAERISSLVSLDGATDWFMLADSLSVEEIPHEVHTFGSVERATWYHDGLIDSVMVKTLVPELAIPARDLLAKELQQWFSLPPHPSIPKLYGGCHIASELWYAYELAANGNVLDFFRNGDQRYNGFCRVFVSVAQGLQFLHEHGIVHGALTCSNILVTKDGSVLLSDFGFQSVRTLASTLNDEASKAASSSMRWKAKELLSGEEADEPRFAADVYSLGICMVEFLTREIPFKDMTDEEVMDEILLGKFPHNDVYLPVGLWDLITSFCDPDYTKRPRIGEVITQISQFTINPDITESITISETVISDVHLVPESVREERVAIVSAETSQTTSADVDSTETTKSTETSEDVSASTSDGSGDVTRSVTDRDGTSGWTDVTGVTEQTSETSETTETTEMTVTEDGAVSTVSNTDMTGADTTGSVTTETTETSETMVAPTTVTTASETTVTLEDVSRGSDKVTGQTSTAFGVGAAVATGAVIGSAVGSAVSATRSQTTTSADVGSTETTDVTETMETVSSKGSSASTSDVSSDSLAKTFERGGFNTSFPESAAAALVTPEVEHVRRSIPSDNPNQVAVTATTAGKHIRDSDRRTTLLIDGAASAVELDGHYIEVKSPRHDRYVDHDDQWTVQPRSIEWSISKSMTFSADIDSAAQEIQRICSGASIDETALAALLLSKTVEQRYLIWWRYRILYKDTLTVRVKSTSSYGVLLRMLASPPEHVEAEILRKATKGLGATKKWIYPVVMARSNAEIALLKKTYKENYGGDLVTVLKGNLSGDLKKVILTAMRGDVAEFDADVYTIAKADADAEALYDAGEGRIGTEGCCGCRGAIRCWPRSHEQMTFINILVLSPVEHVRSINRAYQAKYNTDIKAAIKNEFCGTAKLALLFLVRSILEPINVLAELFETTLKRASKSTFGLRARKHAYEQSAWVVRYYRLLVQIRVVYRRMFRQELRTRIQSVVSGEHCQLLLSIFDAAETEFGSTSSASGGAAVSVSRATSRASAAAISASALVEGTTSASIVASESASVPDAQIRAYQPPAGIAPRIDTTTTEEKVRDPTRSSAGGLRGHFTQAEEDEDISTTDVTFEKIEEVPATTTEWVETTEKTSKPEEITKVTFETTEIVEKTVEETEVTESKKPDSKKRRKPTAGTTEEETTEVTKETTETVEMTNNVPAEEITGKTTAEVAKVTEVTEVKEMALERMEEATAGHGSPCPNCTLTLCNGEQWCRFCGASQTVADEDACRQSFAKYTNTRLRTEVWQRVYELSMALRELHNQGVIHGDLKPANIRIGRDGKAHLSGFTFSRRSIEPQANPVVRTDSLRWKAPECLAGGDTSEESDVYSLGMCIIHAISGQPPWGGALSDDKVKHLVEQHKMPPRPDRFTDAEWELIESMCCHDPKKRERLEEIVTTLGQLKRAGIAPELRIDRSTISFSETCFSDTPLVSRYQGRWKDAVVAVEQVQDVFKRSNRSFLGVAELWLSLKYPTLLQLYGSCEDGGHQLFVCEFAEQGDLRTYIQQHPVDPTEPLIWQILLDAALGVQYLHTTNIVHGDITLDNILVTQDGKGKLSGFLRSINLDEDEPEDEPEEEPMVEPKIAILSDVSSLGRCFLDVFSDDPQRSDRSTACAAPATQPDAVCDEAWRLIMDMCSEPCPRIDIVRVVQRLARLAAATKAVQSKLSALSLKLSLAQLKTMHMLVIEEMIEIEQEEQRELEEMEEDELEDAKAGLGRTTDRKEVSKRQMVEKHANDAVTAVFKDLDAKLLVPFTPKCDQAGPRKLKSQVPWLRKADLFAWMIIPESVQQRSWKSSLGNGVSANVFRGAWLGAPVALKTMVKNTSSNLKDLITVNVDDLVQDQALHEEANIWFCVRHPNVVSLFGVCTEGYQTFVCDLVEGGNLDTISRRKVIPRDKKKKAQLWGYLHDAAIGLQGLHLHGIVHADLKCDNILVGKNGRAKLIDFGLSCLRTCDGGKPRGAYRWKAPECLKGAGPTVESDVFSFGICIYQAISGRYPWEQVNSDLAVRKHIIDGKLPAKPDDCTTVQWGLITRMCRFNPDDRLQLDVVVQALGFFANREPYTTDKSLQHTLAEWQRVDENCAAHS